MAYLQLKIKFFKHNDLVLIKSINDFYLKPNHQFLCLHPELLPTQQFKNYHTRILNIYNYEKYYDKTSKLLIYNNYYLVNEKNYALLYSDKYSQLITKIYNDHLNCNLCSELISNIRPTPDDRKKRAKLSDDELINIDRSISKNYLPKQIKEHFNISHTTYRKRKSINKNNLPLKSKRKERSYCLTKLEKEKIIKLVNNEVVDSAIKIKHELKLKASLYSIKLFLKSNKFKFGNRHLYYYLSEKNLSNKIKWCKMSKTALDTNLNTFNKVIFTDEKILYSFSNHHPKVYRINYSKKRGIGFDKRFIYRREVQSKVKINMFGQVLKSINYKLKINYLLFK